MLINVFITAICTPKEQIAAGAGHATGDLPPCYGSATPRRPAIANQDSVNQCSHCMPARLSSMLSKAEPYCERRLALDSSAQNCP
jgi:hypothetical protein